MPRKSTLRRLAEEMAPLKLGAPLDDYVGEARGNGQSWRAIEADITSQIGIVLNRETLRGWFGVSEERSAETANATS